MSVFATTHSLNNYPRLSITSYRDQLRQAGKADKIDLNYKYRNQSYSYSINLTKTACNYGNYRYWCLRLQALHRGKLWKSATAAN